MSRIAPPAEKIDAVCRIFKTLANELDMVDRNDARVQASLIDASVHIAMSTDTRDMGIIGDPTLLQMAANPAATVPPHMRPSGPGYESGPGRP